MNVLDSHALFNDCKETIKVLSAGVTSVSKRLDCNIIKDTKKYENKTINFNGPNHYLTKKLIYEIPDHNKYGFGHIKLRV